MSFKLPEQEIEELRKLQHNVIGRTDYARVTCILMLALDFSPDLVAQSLSIDVATVYRYKDLYVRGKTDIFLEDHYKGYWGRLESGQISLLCEELERHLSTDAKSVSEWVKDTFGIAYTPAGMVDLLNRIGFTYSQSKMDCELSMRKFRVRSDLRLLPIRCDVVKEFEHCVSKFMFCPIEFRVDDLLSEELSQPLDQV